MSLKNRPAKKTAVGTDDGPWRVRVIDTDNGDALVGVGRVFASRPDEVGNERIWFELFQHDNNFSYLKHDRGWEVYIDPNRVPGPNRIELFQVKSASPHYPKHPLQSINYPMRVPAEFHATGWYAITETEAGKDARRGFLHVTKPDHWLEEVFENTQNLLIWPRRELKNADGTVTQTRVDWCIRPLVGPPADDLSTWYVHRFETAPA